MHNDLWYHASNKIPHETDGEPEASPVVSVFQDLKSVTLEINLAIKVHIVKCLHWYLIGSMIFGLIGGILERQVVLHWPPWKLHFFIPPRAER